MNPRLTRQELLRRGAAGGALLAFPSLLAACGGGGGGSSRRRRAERRSQLLELAVLHRHAGVAQGCRPDGSDDARAVHDEDGDQGQLLRGHQLELGVLRDRPGPPRQGQGIGRDIIVSTDNDRFPGRVHLDKAGRRSSTRPSSRTSRTSSTRRRAHRSTRTGSTRSPGSREWTGSRGTRRSPGPITTVTQLLDRPEAQGQGRGLELDGRHARARHARERRRSGEGHRRVVRPCAGRDPESPGRGPDPQVLRQRLRATARDRRSRRDHGVVRRHPQLSAIRRSSGASRRRAGSSSRTTCSSRPAAACRRRRRS